MSRPNYDFGLYDAPPMADLRAIIDYAERTYGDRPAFIYQNNPGEEPVKISYHEYRQDIAAVAAGLVSSLKIDLTRRDSKRIALIAPNSYWWSVCYFAVVNLGHVIVPLSPDLPTEDLLTFLQRAGVSSLFFTGQIDDKIAALKPQLSKIKHYISIDESAQGSITLEKVRRIGYKSLHRKPDLYNNVRVYPEMLATLIFTSGSTSTPKGVMLTHKNLASDAVAMRAFNNYRQEALLSVLPLCHSYEFMMGLLFEIYMGSTVYYLPGGLHAFQENLAKVRPTVMVLVPLIVEEAYKRVRATLDDPDDRKELAAALKEYYGGRLTRIMVGGAPLSPEVAEAYDQCGIKLLQGYGISECSPVVCMNPDRHYKSSSVGMALPGIRVKLDEVNDEGIGEVIVRGPTVMLGYYKDERKTDEALIDNWLHTGDYGRFDDDGFLYIIGRKKNVIIGKNAQKIYPEEVEYHLTSHPEIKETLVYGKVIGDDTKVAALIVADTEMVKQLHPEMGRNPRGKKLEELIEKLVDEVNVNNVKYKRIADWQLVSSLPRTPNGKIKRGGN